MMCWASLILKAADISQHWGQAWVFLYSPVSLISSKDHSHDRSLVMPPLMCQALCSVPRMQDEGDNSVS